MFIPLTWEATGPDLAVLWLPGVSRGYPDPRLRRAQTQTLEARAVPVQGNAGRGGEASGITAVRHTCAGGSRPHLASCLRHPSLPLRRWHGEGGLSGPGVLSTQGAPDSDWKLLSVFPQPTRDSVWRCVCSGRVLNSSASHKGQPGLSGAGTKGGASIPGNVLSATMPPPPLNCSKWPSLWPIINWLLFLAAYPSLTSHLCLVSHYTYLKTHWRHSIFQEPSLKPSSPFPGLSQVPLLR